MTEVERSSEERKIADALGELEHQLQLCPTDGVPIVSLSPEHLHGALERLRDGAGFAMVTLITAVDRFGSEPRFELTHQLLCVEDARRVRLRTRVGSEKPSVPTCIDLWPGAAFMERECFDMFGVHFEGHENLRRLLMPEGYGHHPLRKDFPHQGIEPDRLYREWDEKRREGWAPQS